MSNDKRKPPHKGTELDTQLQSIVKKIVKERDHSTTPSLGNRPKIDFSAHQPSNGEGNNRNASTPLFSKSRILTNKRSSRDQKLDHILSIPESEVKASDIIRMFDLPVPNNPSKAAMAGKLAVSTLLQSLMDEAPNRWQVSKKSISYLKSLAKKFPDDKEILRFQSLIPKYLLDFRQPHDPRNLAMTARCLRTFVASHPDGLSFRVEHLKEVMAATTIEQQMTGKGMPEKLTIKDHLSILKREMRACTQSGFSWGHFSSLIGIVAVATIYAAVYVGILKTLTLDFEYRAALVFLLGLLGVLLFGFMMLRAGVLALDVGLRFGRAYIWPAATVVVSVCLFIEVAVWITYAIFDFGIPPDKVAGVFQEFFESDYYGKYKAITNPLGGFGDALLSELPVLPSNLPEYVVAFAWAIVKTGKVLAAYIVHLFAPVSGGAIIVFAITSMFWGAACIVEALFLSKDH